LIGRLFAVVTLAVFTAGTPGLVRDARAAAAAKVSLQSVIDGAKKEGVLNFYASAAMGPDGGRALKDALNKKYGLNLDLQFTGSGSMKRGGAKVGTELLTRSPPAWGGMVGHA